MSVETIGDWERRRGFDLVEEQIADLPETAEPVVQLPEARVENRLCVALLGRVTAGLGVQLLWDPRSGDTFVTCTLDGQCETFQVEPEEAREAFLHPFAYGCTLPL